MPGLRHQIKWKYVAIELCFIFFITFLISLISDLEYSYYEEHDISRFSKDLGYRLVTETSALLLFAVYYYGFIKRLVFQRRTLAIVLTTLVFFVFDRLYNKYVLNWIVINSPIISAYLRARASTAMQAPGINFAVNYLLISVVIPALGLAFFIRTMQQDAQMQALKEQQLVSELNYLKAQLHPHFFFNTINNIYALALKRSADAAPIVAKLGEMMRYILYEADQPAVFLSREIAFLTSYIEVEKIRHHKNINIEFDAQGVNTGVMIQPMLLLPFIENAFKHGLEQETSAGFVSIIVCHSETELTLNVINSKPAAVANGIPGIGLQNVVKRLKLAYPGKYSYQVNDAPGQYEVTLTLVNT